MRRYHALGRLKVGTMNRTETAFAQHLEDQRIVGQVLWWRFEAIKLRLADGCWFSPDFAALEKDGSLVLYEVKGKTRKRASDGRQYDAAFALDDSKVKLRVAADTFPLRIRLVYPATGGGWHEDEI